jgi:hypothetical protein
MKLSAILAALAFAAAAPIASARNCKAGLNYCGHSLLSIGKSAQIFRSVCYGEV